MLCSVYGLHSTQDMELRYIGQTRQVLEARRVQHLAEALLAEERTPDRLSHLHKWIRKVVRSGFEIGITLVEADCVRDEAERQWIAFYRSIYPGQITNIADGGPGYGGQRSWKTRLRMSGRHDMTPRQRAIRTAPKRDVTRAKMALAQLGNTKGVGEKNAQAVLSVANVIDIKHRLLGGESLSRIAAVYGVTKAAISKIRTGRTWRSVQLTEALLREDNGRHGQRGDGDP